MVFLCWDLLLAKSWDTHRFVSRNWVYFIFNWKWVLILSFYTITICDILFIFIIVSGFLNWVDLSFVLMNSKQIFVHYVVRLEKLNGKIESSIFFCFSNNVFFIDNRDEKSCFCRGCIDHHYLSFWVYFDFSIVFCLYLKAL